MSPLKIYPLLVLLVVCSLIHLILNRGGGWAELLAIIVIVELLLVLKPSEKAGFTF